MYLCMNTERVNMKPNFLYFNLKTLHLTEVEIKLSIRDFFKRFQKETISR